MTSVLFDSDILIEHLRERNPEIRNAFEALVQKDASLFCSPVSIAELWCGARPGETRSLENLISILACLPIDETIGRQAGDYLRQYQKSHGVEIADALIAATAAVHGLELWTRNRKHYPMRIRFFAPVSAK